MARALLAVCLAVFPAVACHRSSPSTAESAKPARGGTLTVSLRSEPRTFNRYVPGGESSATDVINNLTQARLVRLNRATDQIEPWLAERWTTSADGQSFTLSLRRGLTFSDGAPFSSADVLFSFRVLYDPQVNSVLAAAVKVQGKELKVSAPDANTVVVTLPAPFAPGLRLLDNVPILPKHQLEAALDAHTFKDAWGLSTPPGAMAGLGPFVVAAYAPGQRVTLSRNPKYWRKDASGIQLPYIDHVILEVVPSQDGEVLRMEAGSIDLMAQADIRPEDYAALKQLRDQGSLSLIDVGTSVDPNLLWFNLTPARAAKNQRAYLQRVEFRQAVSCAVDRDAIVNAVYLGAAVPVYGPETPGDGGWFANATPGCAHDLARAKTLLAAAGLTDRNGDGKLEEANGTPVRFSVLTQAGMRERVVTMIQEQMRQLGIAIDIVRLDPPAIFQRFGAGDYDAIYFGFQKSDTDPSSNLDFWLSSGDLHVWNPGQPRPSTPWEQRVDDLMQRQIAAPTLEERRRLFTEVQKVFGENAPAIAFVAPKVSIAMSRRVAGAVPSLLDPKILWNSDTLYLTDAGSR